MLASRQLTRLVPRLRPSAATVHSRYLSTLQPSESAETSSAWAITSAGALAALFAVNVAASQGSARSVIVEDRPGIASASSASAANAEEESSVDYYDDDLPIYTSEEVAKHNGKALQSIWMSYGGNIYDVTDFVANHPGGSEKIMLAAGGCIEPHWHLYRQHFASNLPQQLMEKMIIGHLHPADQEKVDLQMEKLADETADPYENEPTRNAKLIVHGDTPMNAEVPRDVITQSYITPEDMFYIRHHHPVPLLSEKDAENFELEVDLRLINEGATKVTLDQIKSLPKIEVTTTLQCSGNRRSGFNDFRRTSGTPWDQGAISTAKWGGARLVDVLMLASKDADGDAKPATSSSLLESLQCLQNTLSANPNLQHLRFESIDGMKASIDINKAFNPFGDVLVAYEMNGKPLPRDHGYPLRVIVPGYAAVRNVKWLSKLELADSQAVGAWQRGLNYKILPPSVTDARSVNLDDMPGLGEVAVFSGVTSVELNESESLGELAEGTVDIKPGDTVDVKASGWAWAGGGRNIVRVDVTGDGGKGWCNASLTQGASQPYGRAWAWVFWECDKVPATVCEDGKSVVLSCKGVDMAFNSQPESSDGLWNVRGLANNSWYRLRHSVVHV